MPIFYDADKNLSNLDANYFPPAPRAPSGGGMLRSLLDPGTALPIAAALMGGGGNRQNFADALGQLGPALQRNRTLNWLKQKDPELAELVERGGMEVGEAYRLATARHLEAQKAPTVETFYDENTGREFKQQWQGGKWVPVGGSKAPKGDEGLEIELADGTTVRQGTFGNQDRKNVANRVNDEQTAAAAASSLKDNVTLMRKANNNTGYSGVGGSIYGAVDDTMEQFGMGGWLPGNAASRATMTSGGLNVALSKVQQTKGAISNKEMDLFTAASPGLQNTPQGNAALLDIMDGIADRQMQRTQAMEQWRQQYGTLDGFEGEWGKYIEANPLITETEDGSMALNPGAGRMTTGTGTGGGTSRLRKTSNGVPWSLDP
jgi:hypothetical protein